MPAEKVDRAILTLQETIDAIYNEKLTFGFTKYKKDRVTLMLTKLFGDEKFEKTMMMKLDAYNASYEIDLQK